MFPIILERDTPIIDWQSYLEWCDTEMVAATQTGKVRSDGVLKVHYGTLDSVGSTGAITARKSVCLGLHITGPEPGVEFTPYSVSVVAMAADKNVRPYLFVAESPAVITNDADGDTVTDLRLLGLGPTPGTDGANLEKDVTVVVTEKTADRALCFGVGMMAGVAGGLDVRGYFRLSVRRLVGPGPRIVDARKL